MTESTTATRATTTYEPPIGAVRAAASPAEERHLRFRPDIEGLRAVAIVLVVLYHAGWRGARAGFLGVDVFFVLSGFLITGLLARRDRPRRGASRSRSSGRGARAGCCRPRRSSRSSCSSRAPSWLSPFDQRTFADTARAFAVYGSNILFAWRSTDYFGGAAVRDPLLHTWSLSVEEQFYLFFAPAMLVVALWLRAARPRGGASSIHHRRDRRHADLPRGLRSACRRYPVIAFYALPDRAWEFGLGALAVLAARRAGKLSWIALDAARARSASSRSSLRRRSSATKGRSSACARSYPRSAPSR